MTRHRFTADEDALIVAEYSRRQLGEIAEQLSRDVATVQNRARVLAARGLLDVQTRFHHRTWTAAELQDLKGWYGYRSARQIGRALHRSAEAVRIKAVRLHLSAAHRPGIYNARQVAAIFNVDPQTVIRIWIRTRRLKARRSDTRAAGSFQWQITFDAIEAFMRAHVGLYDYHRIARGTYWRELAESLQRGWLSATQAALRLQVDRETVRRHLRCGWLPGEKVRGIAGQGDWRIREVDLAKFRPRHVLGGGGWATRRARQAARIAA